MVTLSHQRITALQFLQSDSIEQLQAFELLTNNKLSPRIIDPLTFEELFIYIAQTLQEQYPHFSITNPNTDSVYDRPTVTHYINSDYVYVYKYLFHYLIMMLHSKYLKYIAFPFLSHIKLLPFTLNMLAYQNI